MECFDLQTSPRPGFTKAPPPGYEVGRVRIGGSDETIFFSTEIWSPSDYAEHWKAASKLLLQGERSLICTDLTKHNASIFIGFPVGSGFEFEQWVVPWTGFRMDGLLLRIAHARRSGNASCWHVSPDAITAFAFR
jgi:hypothetical protein